MFSQTADQARHKALRDLVAQLARHDYQFTTITPATHARVNRRDTALWARDLRGVFGWNRRFDPAMLPQGMFEAMQSAAIAVQDADGWKSRFRVSTLNGMLFVHSAFPTTTNDSVFFGPDTYRYVAAIEQHLRHGGEAPGRVVDIGCGAGPGAIVLARRFPEAEVLAVDINDTALELTRLNADTAGVNNLATRHSDLLHDVEGDFDLIVANPPYLLDPQERAYRHGGGTLGAGLSVAIVDLARQRLSSGGSLILYTGVAIVDGKDRFLEAARQRLDEAGLRWSYREIDPDVFGEELSSPGYGDADRIAAVVLTATRVN